MSDHSLHDIYSRVQPNFKQVFVVPRIRFDFPNTDYLYLLYAPFINSKADVRLHSTSALGHWKFFGSQLLGQKPILHYHWLEFQDYKSLFGMIYKIKMLWFYKLMGGKIVWSIHNLKPHDGKWLKSHLRLHRWMAKISDVLLVHSKSQIKQVSELYSVSSKKIDVLPHPNFPAMLIDRSEAIEKLNSTFDLKLDPHKIIVGSFGAVSEYKNFLNSISLLKSIDFDGNYLIIGYVKKGQSELDKKLKKLSNELSWFHYKPGFVSEDLLPVIMNSFHFSLFNFKEISTSGGVEIARSYKNKIIAPRKGILSDYESEKDVQLFSSQDELRSLLKALMDK